VVGPSSHADSVQKDFHKLIGADEPLGWRTQLPDEPVINVDYTTTYLLAGGRMGTSASWRVVPLATAGLGNYFTGAGLGIYGEIGWNLVDALGGTALRSGLNAASKAGVGPVDGWSVSFSGGLAGYGVAHYLPLDGTVFRDSRSVDSEPFIGMATFGISVRHRDLVFGLAKTYFTNTFETQRKRPDFGTLSLSWYF
jgi:lipid A 3-O-deacylase